MNRHLLVSDARHFRVDHEINPWMHHGDQPDADAAAAEHAAIVAAHRAAGRRVEHLPSSPSEPDMVFVANAALVHGDVAVLGMPPPERAGEIPHVRRWLAGRGYDVVASPYAFGGQGDALGCGDLLLAGHGHRTDHRTHEVLANALGYTEVVPLRTVSAQWYDLDLALGVVVPGRTLAWCPEAFGEAGRARIRGLGLELIDVDLTEARRFALNLVSDGTTVVMTAGAPLLAKALRARDLEVVELALPQLAKGGGGVRCTALTLDG